MIKYYKHLDRYVVKIKEEYLTWCSHLKIYILSGPNDAEVFKTKEKAKEALDIYKKFK